MKEIPFERAQFLRAVLAEEEIPTFCNVHHHILPEIALIGRSNVGKSSLINHLLKHKYLAKVSSTPGKTQSINFFQIDDQLILVDLPGYGFAKVAKDLKEKWSSSIERFLKTRSTLKLLLLLMDIRRLPSEEDIAFIEWAHFHRRPLLCVLTKHDKLTEAEKKKQITLFEKAFQEIAPHTKMDLIPYSIKDGQGRKLLIRSINSSLETTWA